MKRIFICVSVLLIVAACTATKTTTTVAASPVGDWDYSITGTPQGDFSGVLSVTQSGTGYVAKMTGSNGDLPFNVFAFNTATKKVTGEFDYSGTPVAMNADLATDTMNGMMSAGGMDFPFKATRKK